MINQSKTFIKNKVKTILNSPIGIDNDENYKFIEEIFQLHEDYDEFKDYEKITIRTCPRKRHCKEFYFHYSDKTKNKSQSYIKAIDGYNARTENTHKFREIIQVQIDLFKSQNIHPETCSICKEHISFGNWYDVDHEIIKFRDILKNFCEKYNIDLNSQITFTNKLTEDWYNYHEDNAKLRYICHRCNLKLH